jgi:Flp pilus assembly pilin Flp
LSLDTIEQGVVMSLIHAMRAHVRHQEGQTFVEYALILAVVVVGVLLLVTWSGLGDAIQAAIDAVSAAV